METKNNPYKDIYTVQSDLKPTADLPNEYKPAKKDNNLSLYQIEETMFDLLEMIESGEAYNDDGTINEVFEEQLHFAVADFKDKAVDYGYVIKTITDKASAFDAEIKRLQEAKRYFDKTTDRIKERLIDAMVKFNINKVEGKTLTLSLRKSESVKITDADILAQEFKRIKPIEYLPDKVKIKQAIKDGERVDGAELAESFSLTIK